MLSQGIPGLAPAGASGTDTAQVRERRLLEGLRAGDDRSYAALVREYGGAMLAVARRVLRDEEDARDAVQDAFLQVVRSIEGFRGQCGLATWLHRIVWNASLMKLRHAKRRPEVSIETLLPSFDETGHRVGDVTQLPPDPEDALERKRVRATLEECVGRLPASYRTVFLLRDVEGRSTKETAGILETSETAVKVRLHRARKAIATLLSERLERASATA